MRKMLIAGLIVCGAVLSLAVEEAAAVPGQDKTNIYFADETFKEAVGEELVLSCYRRVNVMLWGVKSRFYRVESSPCGDNGGGAKPPQCFVYDGYRFVPVPCN